MSLRLCQLCIQMFVVYISLITEQWNTEEIVINKPHGCIESTKYPCTCVFRRVQIDMADSPRSLENIRISIEGCGETNVWAAKKQGMTFVFEGRESLREAEEVGRTQM